MIYPVNYVFSARLKLDSVPAMWGRGLGIERWCCALRALYMITLTDLHASVHIAGIYRWRYYIYYPPDNSPGERKRERGRSYLTITTLILNDVIESQWKDARGGLFVEFRQSPRPLRRSWNHTCTHRVAIVVVGSITFLPHCIAIKWGRIGYTKHVPVIRLFPLQLLLVVKCRWGFLSFIRVNKIESIFEKAYD